MGTTLHIGPTKKRNRYNRLVFSHDDIPVGAKDRAMKHLPAITTSKTAGGSGHQAEAPIPKPDCLRSHNDRRPAFPRARG